MSQFWKNHEEDSIINELPLGISSDNNNAIRLMKQKEVERKFQEFFSFNNAATAPQKIPQNQPQTSILRIKDQNDNRNHYQAENEPKKKPITTNNVRDENPLKTQSNCESKFELLSKMKQIIFNIWIIVLKKMLWQWEEMKIFMIHLMFLKFLIFQIKTKIIKLKSTVLHL